MRQWRPCGSPLRNKWYLISRLVQKYGTQLINVVFDYLCLLQIYGVVTFVEFLPWLSTLMLMLYLVSLCLVHLCSQARHGFSALNSLSDSLFVSLIYCGWKYYLLVYYERKTRLVCFSNLNVTRATHAYACVRRRMMQRLCLVKKNTMQKKKIFRHIKLVIHAWSTKCR
jgi:hypothetical protein